MSQEVTVIGKAVRTIVHDRDMDLSPTEKITLTMAATELDRLSGEVQTAKDLLVTMIESDSVSEVSSANDRLNNWALGGIL